MRIGHKRNIITEGGVRFEPRIYKKKRTAIKQIMSMIVRVRIKLIDNTYEVDHNVCST